MKKLLFLLVMLFSITSMTTYASFPVAGNNVESEVVVTQMDDGGVQVMPTEFKFGGFILGFLLGLIGVGLAYIFSKNPDFIRSAWYGCGTWAILYILLLAASA
tara:strand:+ start:163 stop:471 length:309 start_codon:yes stop_codon:yes gene_type:complete